MSGQAPSSLLYQNDLQENTSSYNETTWRSPGVLFKRFSRSKTTHQLNAVDLVSDGRNTQLQVGSILNAP